MQKEALTLEILYKNNKYTFLADEPLGRYICYNLYNNKYKNIKKRNILNQKEVIIL